MTKKFGTRSCAENSADVLLAEFAIATNKMARLLDWAPDNLARTGMLFEGYGVDHLQCQLAPIRKTVNELMDTKTARLIGVTFTLLCAFLIIFIIGFPKSFIGLAQRLAEASMFPWQFWVAILGIAYLERSITCVSYLVCIIYINTVKGKNYVPSSHTCTWILVFKFWG